MMRSIFIETVSSDTLCIGNADAIKRIRRMVPLIPLNLLNPVKRLLHIKIPKVEGLVWAYIEAFSQELCPFNFSLNKII